MNRYVALRYERGYTQTDVIDGTGISRGTIYNLEQGGTPSAPVARKLADFYGLTVGQVLGIEPTEREAA